MKGTHFFFPIESPLDDRRGSCDQFYSSENNLFDERGDIEFYIHLTLQTSAPDGKIVHGQQYGLCFLLVLFIFSPPPSHSSWLAGTSVSRSTNTQKPLILKVGEDARGGVTAGVSQGPELGSLLCKRRPGLHHNSCNENQRWSQRAVKAPTAAAAAIAPPSPPPPPLLRLAGLRTSYLGPVFFHPKIQILLRPSCLSAPLSSSLEQDSALGFFSL